MDVRVERSETVIEETAELIRTISERIAERTNGRIRDLEVEITQGVVRVRGRTSRFYFKQLATSAVLDSDFGLELENEISVGVR